LFPTYIFLFVFAPITFIGYWVIKGDRMRRLWLTIASYIFYGYWDWKFTSLLLISSAINFYAGGRIGKSEDQSTRKFWLVAGLVGSLGLLAYFKYFRLVLITLDAISNAVGGGDIAIWNIILPIGISFFTFQAMSYTIDIYNRKVEPTNDFIEFACYVALFPQLIAGPIVRYRWISETLRNLPKKFTLEYLDLALFYFSIGLIKKVLIADRIANYINPMFDNYQALVPSEAWAAIIGFSLQLYFDFAGYSLMAIGLGHLLGFKFPQNFNSPYKAVSISDFWRRWHITLSTWLRDYLYIPLGGRNNRLVALAVTMLLGGLWHGAYWTFVAWGAYHAILLELHHHLQNFRWIPRNRIYAQLWTFLVATIGWVFFRPPDFTSSWAFLQKMFDIPGLITEFHVSGKLLILIFIAFIWAYFLPNACELVRDRGFKPNTICAVVLALLTVLSVMFFYNPAPFLYFQF